MAVARPARLPLWVDALLLGAFKLGVSAFVLAGGFRAVSDDDYSRIVIAQGFVEAPRLDPTGTSWLPFPFWVHGIAHALFGAGLEVARATALALGVGSCLLVWAAARLLGASRAGALLGATLAGAFPYSAWLGVAAVPEAITAALVVFGAASLSATSARWRTSGALALFCACFSRYEAWPVAALFGVFTALDARRSRALWPAALGALGAPALWLLHGLAVHGDALFFVQRVTAYRAALGGPEDGFGERLLFYPLALLRHEPELAALGIIALITARVARLGAALAPYRRLGWCLLGLLLFLITGSLRGGVPTHHAERALLALWFGLAMFSADALARAWRALSARARGIVALATALELGGALLLRSYVSQREAFSARDAELDIGQEARLQGAPRLLVATDDYGYFAVIASFGAPRRAEPLASRDPRRPREADALSSPELVRETLARHPSAWLVAPRRYEPTLREVGRIAARNQGFVLMEAKR